MLVTQGECKKFISNQPKRWLNEGIERVVQIAVEKPIQTQNNNAQQTLFRLIVGSKVNAMIMFGIFMNGWLSKWLRRSACKCMSSNLFNLFNLHNME